MDDRELDRILSARIVPVMPSALTARILKRLDEENDEVVAVLLGWFKDFFIIPQPAVVLTACLVVGLFLGIQAESTIALSNTDWGSYMEVSEPWS